MKLRNLLVPLCVVALGACTTYPAQTVSNVEQEEQVVEVVEAGAVTAEETTVQAENADEDGDRVICRRVTPTGSRFRKRYAELGLSGKDLQEQSKGLTGQMQQRSRLGNAGSEGGE